MKKYVSFIGSHIIGWFVGYAIFSTSIYFIIDNVATFKIPYGMEYTPYWQTVALSLFSAILVGIPLGIIDGIAADFLKRKRSFRTAFLFKCTLYILILFFMMLFIGVFFRTYMQGQDLENSIKDSMSTFTLNYMIAYFIFSVALSIMINFINQVNKMLGKGKLLPLFLGRYSHPRVEDRIFMFLDLKSSTTHAETLGHLLYSELIQDCFYDLNQVIVKYDARIYQYVGDEAVLTWRLEQGIKDTNCLYLFFEFQKRLEKRTPYYQDKYGLVPTFKAGINNGEVTVTEVGDVKREIAYHGDVLNTAARIQSVCNQYQKELLISENLYKKLPNNGLQKDLIGELELKGKLTAVKVYSVQKMES